jgi:hypothetical protein
MFDKNRVLRTKLVKKKIPKVLILYGLRAAVSAITLVSKALLTVSEVFNPNQELQ